MVQASNLVEVSPHKSVVLASFSFSGKFNRDEMAFAQYKLLLNTNVLQAHLDLASMKGNTATLPGADFVSLLKELGVEPHEIKSKTVSYKEFVSLNKNN